MAYPNYISVVLFLQYAKTTGTGPYDGAIQSRAESCHCTAEGNGSHYVLSLLGDQAVPEVCLLGADGQLLWLPASGGGRIEFVPFKRCVIIMSDKSVDLNQVNM